MSSLKKSAFAILASFFMFTFCDDGGVNENPNAGGDCTSGVDCPDNGNNVNPNVNYGNLTDSRNGKTYRTIEVGTQTWMSENLNYDVPDNTRDDVCYENSADSCEKYGRLYSGLTARSVCPAGWHLPTDNEWTLLVSYAGDAPTAGKKLKSASGWYNFDGVPDGAGTDDYGFSALPGGMGSYSYLDLYFSAAGTFGHWWSATGVQPGTVWSRSMYYAVDAVSRTSYEASTTLHSVRCVKDK